MRHSPLSIVCVCLIASPLAVWAQGKPAPDLSGVWTRKWETAGTYDAPPSGPGPVMVDPAHPHVGLIAPDGSAVPNARTTPWVADYSNPILKPQTREVVKRITDGEIAGHPHVEHQTLCLPSGVPEILNLRDNVQLLQAASGKEIVMFYMRDSQVRHVYMDVPHSKNPPKSWYGESVGHYEGDTLVIDTIGLNDKTDTDRFGTPHSDQMHVVERYRVSNDKKTLDVSFTVDDPKYFTSAWSGKADYRRDSRPVLETICAENNRPIGFGEQPAIPTATTFDF